MKKLWVKRNRRTVGDERLRRIDGYRRSRGHGIEVLCWLLRGESRKRNETKRGLEPHPEMGESMEVACEGGGDLFFLACEEAVYLFSDVAVVDVTKLLFGTWIGNRLNRVAHVVCQLQLGSQFSSNEN